MRRQDLVALARCWIGTPYLHQGAVKGVGCDCLGLIRGLWLEVRGSQPEAVPPYSPDWSEAGRHERLWLAASRHLVPRNGAPVPGSVLLFRMRRGAVAKHLGIAASAGQPQATVDFTDPVRACVDRNDQARGAAGHGNPERIVSDCLGQRPVTRDRAGMITGISDCPVPARASGPGSISTRRTGFDIADPARPVPVLSFIHAYSGQGVVESPFSKAWAGHLVAAFDFPWTLD